MAEMEAKYLHVDINSYFATLLQQENPKLRYKPVGVVKNIGRTCIIAASKEAKKFGVKTGSLLKEARNICPQIIIVPAEFDIYLDTTRKLKKIFEDITPDAEIFSLDEAFLPLENLRYLHPDPIKLASEIKAKIKEVLGEWVTCNIGIAKTRLLAKIASESAPKDSIFEVTQENKEELLKTVNFSDVCGVGIRLEERLKNLNVLHPFDLKKIDLDTLVKEFGPHLAKELKNVGEGEESSILARSANEHMKGIGRTITGYRLCNSEEEIKRILYNLSEEVTYKTRKMDLGGRQAGVFLQGEESTWHSHKTLKFYIRHTNDFFGIIYHDLYKKWKRSFRVIRFGVSLSLLEPMNRIQPPLFTEWYRNEMLYKAIDKISQKYGLFSLHSGILTKGMIIRPEVTGYLGDKKFQLEVR